MTAPDRWIVIARWEEFQHPDTARSSVPPWVKAYTKLLANDDFLNLSHHLRGVLLSLWLEYARSTRQLRDSTSAISRRVGQRVTRRDLDALNHAGFIEFSASNPASNTQADLLAEIEKEKTLSTSLSSTNRSGGRATPAAKAAAPRGNDPFRCPLCPETFRRLEMSTTGEWDEKFTLEAHLIETHDLEGDAVDQALANGATP